MPPDVGTAFPPEEFAARRAQVFDQIGPEAFAVIQGAGPVPGFEVFRQTNEFFYLCGVEVPQAYLLLDGRRRATTLFLPHRDPHSTSEGNVLAAEDADKVVQQTGVDEVYGLEELQQHLDGVSVLYLPHSPSEGKLACRDVLLHAAQQIAADPWDAQPSRDQHFMALIRARFSSLELRDLTPILDALRVIKSPCEIDVMRRAGRLCAEAVVEAMRATRPGLFEYQLGAIADYIYHVNGARGEGYRAIIANGPNIWFSHYFRNDCPLVDGDLVLMDYAPDVLNYTSDIGRMWPVNGKYSTVQRELYGFMVQYHKAVLKRIRPGVLPQQVLEEAAAEMRPVVESMSFSKPIYAQAARRTLEFKGHLSHPVGMAVHDVGVYFQTPLQPGLVIAVDPQMWIPEERLYIRVEDTVVVTADGVEVLTDAAPLELATVEALIMQEAPLPRP